MMNSCLMKRYTVDPMETAIKRMSIGNALLWNLYKAYASAGVARNSCISTDKYHKWPKH